MCENLFEQSGDSANWELQSSTGRARLALSLNFASLSASRHDCRLKVRTLENWVFVSARAVLIGTAAGFVYSPPRAVVVG